MSLEQIPGDKAPLCVKITTII